MAQPSFILSNGAVELAVTEDGGHMSPVTFYSDSDSPIQPYFISPWQLEGLPTSNSYLDMFRGDFFCLPFGMARPSTPDAVVPPMHGQACFNRWTPVSCRRSGADSILELGIDLSAPACHVTKRLTLTDAQNVVYITHTITGLEGAVSFSHHATLNVTPERPALISTSPTLAGFVAGPKTVWQDREESYDFLEGGARVESLERVPTLFKEPAYVDVSRVPTMEHFSGGIQFYNKPAKGLPAWTCVYFPEQDFIWYALKNPKVQPLTHFWLEFGGRFQYPWNGRTMCIGVEDMSPAFPRSAASRFPGMAERQKLLDETGIKTGHVFSPDTTFDVNYIEGVCRVEPSFGKVADIEFGEDGLCFIGASGARQTADVNWRYLGL